MAWRIDSTWLSQVKNEVEPHVLPHVPTFRSCVEVPPEEGEVPEEKHVSFAEAPQIASTQTIREDSVFPSNPTMPDLFLRSPARVRISTTDDIFSATPSVLSVSPPSGSHLSYLGKI